MSDQLIRNEYGEVVLMSHPLRTVPPDAFAGGETPTQVANSYVRQNMGEMGLGQSRLEDDEPGLADLARSNDPIIYVAREKDLAGSTVVVYDQTIMGLPIFEARMGVHIDNTEMAVTSVQSSMHGHVVVANPEDIATPGGELEKPTNANLKQMVGASLPSLKHVRVERQVIYRFEPDQRVEQVDDEHEGCFAAHGPPSPSPPDLPPEIAKGKHYVVNEVLFEASRQRGEPPVNWRALLEPKSGAVLYVRALVANATGMVFVKDPQTQTGASVTGASSNAVLNPFRSSEALPGLTPTSPQTLSGEYVELADTSAPTIPPPTIPSASGAFNYDVRTDNFSAVNAYYHCDNLFRTMADYGFNIKDVYFGGTDFPVPVDHRALGNAVNAQAPGNATGTGLGELRFALLQPGQPVGIATSNRVVWHEFGHALLWDHVNSPNFGFAHSAGDSLATILNDPGSNAADRFNTFPWVQEGYDLGRRHNRAIADGWAWFGPQYNTQYQGEQILCTTLFRFYRSIGGDASSLGTQTRAAQTAAYLIFKAIGLFTSTTQFPEVLVNNLQNADITTNNFKGIPGGALHKVVRWAFEKQGLFQPSARPGQGNNVMSEGNPPDVDVYIDDGRSGEYQYQPNFWNCQDMWVRRAPDGGLTHQNPVVGRNNYMYVRVKNRGLQLAWGVNVSGYHCLPGTGLAFPDDWTPMATPFVAASGPIPPGGQTIVGPLTFVPKKVGHECLLAIVQATGDPANDTTIRGTIPAGRFVPFDNNIAQRNVTPVLPSIWHIIELLREHPIWVRNPLRKAVVCRIEILLPRFLRRLGWEMHTVSAGGLKFEMGPRDRREVVFAIEPGREFTPEMVKRAIAMGDHEIQILTYLDDELSGGMTYPLSFDADRDERPYRIEQVDAPESESHRELTINEILRVLGSQVTGGEQLGLDRPVRTVRLEFDLDDD